MTLIECVIYMHRERLFSLIHLSSRLIISFRVQPSPRHRAHRGCRLIDNYFLRQDALLCTVQLTWNGVTHTPCLQAADAASEIGYHQRYYANRALGRRTMMYISRPRS